MEITTPNILQSMITDDGRIIHFATIDIGSWDMDSVQAINVPHGLGALFINILYINAYITNDPHSGYANIMCISDTIDVGNVAGSISYVNNTNVRLWRKAGGFFDSNLFDDAVINRGYISICYFI
jgi:hypothetical protein